MGEPYLHESFDNPALHPLLRWHCEPANWSVDPARRSLRVEPTGGTDFWQRTHYGFEADNGHFLFTEVTGDVVVSSHVRFHPVHQYDQAGLMIRISPSTAGSPRRPTRPTIVPRASVRILCPSGGAARYASRRTSTRTPRRRPHNRVARLTPRRRKIGKSRCRRGRGARRGRGERCGARPGSGRGGRPHHGSGPGTA